MKKIWASILASAALVSQALLGGETFRTDINPALLYYQGFSLRPELSQQDHQWLFTNDWRGQVSDERFGKLMSGFDNSFKIFRRAAKAQVPCDWGLDLTDGPEALLPGLAKAKVAAQTARLRAMWHLQNGKPEEACDDLLATFVMARHVSTDRVLISCMVQFAMENTVAYVIAENFYQLSPEILSQLAEGLEAAPRQGLVVDCIHTEDTSFSRYFIRRIEEFRAEDEGRALARIREVMAKCMVSEEPPAARNTRFEQSGAAKADAFIAAAGGTIEGLYRMFQELPPLYEQVQKILRLPAADFEKPIAEFQSMIKTHPNPLVREFFPLFENARKKEFATQSTMTMVQAAIAYKLRGEKGFRVVLDPCTGGPFEFERFVFEGVDRGFKLKSKYRGRDFDEVLIFVEKPGPLFRVIGKNAGEKVK